MSKKILFLLPCLALSWGKLGHQITAKIAEVHITDTTKKQISNILGNHDLVSVSDWADVIRPSKKFIKWHYSTMNDKGQIFENKKNGLLLFGIKNVIETLRNSNSSNDQKKIALKLLVHLIGDAHQPLHVGNGIDAGGNLCGVKWFKRKKPVSLHKIWDVFLVKAAYAKYPWIVADSLDTPKTKTTKWTNTPILPWLAESRSLHNEIYPEICTNPYQKGRYSHLGEAYVKNNIHIVKDRLVKGGIRLAFILNSIFDDEFNLQSRNRHTKLI